MKKIVIITCLVISITSCNDSTTNEEPTQAPSNVQNVNGNVPDTSNSLNQNSSMPADSSHMKDSMQR